jgi:hypothetical protein
MRVYIFAIVTLLAWASSNPQQATGPDDGIVKNGVYSNNFFGFSFEYPHEWVVHGEATKKRIMEIGKERTTKSGAIQEDTAEVAIKHTHQLLTVFRYALGTPGVGLNPAVLVLAEDVTPAPGITSGREYLLNVSLILVKTGAQLVQDKPEQQVFSGHQFFRQDYRVEVNGVLVHQAMITTVSKGYALTFIFLAADKNTADEFVRTMDTLKFTTGSAVPVVTP